MWIDNGYLHEIRLHSHDNETLPSCVAFGPSGDGARILGDELEGVVGKCVWVFFANSHYEAMSIYYEFLGYGDYSTDKDWDYKKYPNTWYEDQKAYLIKLLQNSHE